MATEADFLRAIIAASDDFLPRRVFADWLDEQGQSARAMLIRDQIEVALTPTDTPARRLAAQRAAATLKKHGKQWAGPITTHCQHWQYRAGFPDLVSLNRAKLQPHAPILFAQTPIRSLLVTHLRGSLAPLASIPACNGITRLSLWGARLRSEQLTELCQLTNLPHLHTLSLLFNQLDDTALSVLTEHPFYCRLRRIELGANPFTDEARATLREVMGERVTFECEREADWLYAWQSEESQSVCSGIGATGTQLIVWATDEGVYIAEFDLAGNLLKNSLNGSSTPLDVDYTTRMSLHSQALANVVAEKGLVETTVYVRRHKFLSRISYKDFLNYHIMAFSYPDGISFNPRVLGDIDRWIEMNQVV